MPSHWEYFVRRMCFAMSILEKNFLILFTLSMILSGFILPKLCKNMPYYTFILGGVINFLLVLTALLIFHPPDLAALIAFSITLITLTLGLYKYSD